MTKTTKSVFARILSLALVMALMLTSVVSSLAFTASATTAEYYKEVIDFESGALPDDAKLGSTFKVEAPVAENGSYSLHRSYSSAMAYVDFYNFDMKAGTTYIISYDYYAVAPADGETYSPAYSTWHNLVAKLSDGTETQIRSYSTSLYGKWYTTSTTYTPATDVTSVRLNANTSDMYFDNITVIEYKAYSDTLGSVYDVDFSDYDKASDAPLYSKSSASIVYDEELGKNVYAVNISSSAATFIPVYTKANTKYLVEYNYKVTDWCCGYYNGSIQGGAPVDQKSYANGSYSFTNGSEGSIFGFGSSASSRTLYISSIKVSEYFDTAVGTAENGTATVSATEAPANTTVTYTATANSGYYFDYWADAQGNKVSTSATYVYTVTADTTLTPVFAKVNNTSAYQSYDFDKVSPTTTVTKESVTGADGNTTTALKLVTSATNNSNKQNIITLDAALENGKSYKLSCDYIGTGYLLPYMGADEATIWDTRLMLENPNYLYLTSEAWTKHTTVITADKSLGALNLATIGNENYAGTLYVDNIVIEEVTLIENTAKKQTYDFDLSVPVISGNSSLEMVADNNGNGTNALKVTGVSSNNNYHMITLEYPLEAGKRYKLSYDYKGSAHVRPYIYTSSNTNTGWDDRQNTEEIGGLDTAYYFISDIWSRHEAVFTANNECGWLSFWVPSWELIDSTNGDTVYFDNIVIEEYTPGFDAYEEDFEDGTTFDGGSLKTKSVGTVTADPLDVSDYSLKLSASQYTAYQIATPKLLNGHTYVMAMDAYSEAGNIFRVDFLNSDGSYVVEDVSKHPWIYSSEDGWKNNVVTYTATADDQYISFFVNAEVYIDNFKLIDITSNENYYEDFSAPDVITLLDNVNADVAYTYDEELGKNIAVITYPETASIDNNKIKIPYLLQDGVQYRVRVTYKNTAWWCPAFNGEVKGSFGSDGVNEDWNTQDWYVTGSGTSDYFSFTTNQSSAVLQISEIKIEIMSGVAGDLDNNGEVLANDLTLLKKYLLGIEDADTFVGAGDIKEDGVVDILDFIRLKKVIAGQTVVTDDASSVSAVAYTAENVTVTTTSADRLEDESSFKPAVSGEDAYIIYKLSGGITEAAVEYAIGAGVMGDFTFEVSRNGADWTEITAQDTAKEEINVNSWVRVTEYFSGLDYVSYLKITFPETESAHIRTVQINGLTADALYGMYGYNSLLREAETVYVSNSGDDNNSGLSENAPLKTLSAAFDRMLVPGDEILLECGSTFEGSVKILSSGTETAPIKVGSYGEGNKPVITGFEDVAVTVTGEYVEIDGIAFTSESADAGIHFYALKDAEKYGANKGLSVTDCNFYEINSVTTSTNISRNSGGVHFMAKGNKPAWFDGITVENNSFDTVARNAIYVTSDWAARDTAQEWGIKNFKLDGSPVYLSKNIVVRNNNIQNNGGDAITLIGTDGALIEYNTVANSALLYNNIYKKDADGEYLLDDDGNKINASIAWAAIWCHSSDNCVMQYNEVYGNRDYNNGQDLQAFDIDLACNNCIVQYNYSHDNDGGFMLLCGNDSATNAGVSGAIVRYNLSVNDGKAGLSVFDITGSVADSQIYNNTVYCGNNNVKLVNLANYSKATVKSSNTVFTNNIFYAADGVSISWGYGDSVTTPAFQNAEFINNVLYNITPPAYEDLITVTNTITTEPVFANAGAEEKGLLNGESYKVSNINELVGAVIENNGGKDYFGNTVSAESTFVGAIN